MIAGDSKPQLKLTADLIAEASAWLAILHGPNRTAETERGFSQWMKKNPAHARAFEEATGIWEEARNLPRPRLLHASFERQPRARKRGVKYAAAAAIAAILATAAVFYAQHSSVETNVGEQRMLALDDGTRVILNTDSRIVISYGHEARRIELKAGEALFEVARKPGWPFIVTAGERRIEALGTSFVVRRDPQQLAVTLVDGKVAVSSISESASNAAVTYLNPGERVMFTDAQPVKKDRPQLEKLLAWQRREVALDNTALSDAVAEMNRYNRVPLRVDVPDAEEIKITGLFRAGDSLSFARAVAEAYGFGVKEEPDAIVLSKQAAR